MARATARGNERESPGRYEGRMQSGVDLGMGLRLAGDDAQMVGGDGLALFAEDGEDINSGAAAQADGEQVEGFKAAGGAAIGGVNIHDQFVAGGGAGLEGGAGEAGPGEGGFADVGAGGGSARVVARVGRR